MSDDLRYIHRRVSSYRPLVRLLMLPTKAIVAKQDPLPYRLETSKHLYQQMPH